MEGNEIKDREIHTWIFGIGGNEVDDVIVEFIRGTKKQALRYMLKRVRGDRSNDPESWQDGTEILSDIWESSTGHYCAHGNYYDYHIDYSITLADEPKDLSPARKRRKDA